MQGSRPVVSRRVTLPVTFPDRVGLLTGILPIQVHTASCIRLRKVLNLFQVAMYADIIGAIHTHSRSLYHNLYVRNKHVCLYDLHIHIVLIYAVYIYMYMLMYIYTYTFMLLVYLL